MTKYREILRLASLGLSQQSIADSSGVDFARVSCPKPAPVDCP